MIKNLLVVAATIGFAAAAPAQTNAVAGAGADQAAQGSLLIVPLPRQLLAAPRSAVYRRPDLARGLPPGYVSLLAVANPASRGLALQQPPPPFRYGAAAAAATASPGGAQISGDSPG